MPSFSEKEAKTKAPALSFRHIVPSANIIKSNPSYFIKNRGVPPPPNSELKIFQILPRPAGFHFVQDA